MKYRAVLVAWMLPVIALAQTVTFEKADYKALGIYDTWEESPFRKGLLKGNYAIVDNFLTDEEEILGMAPNTSRKILAVQRSRFGSNTFGVRIDLNEPFELTPQTKYLHVMVNRPYHGRVMVVGLGKRRDRAGQSPETEQFWAMSTTAIAANKWQDVVLPIKGNGGIDIFSLVVVPDCESPHNETEDRICYIDNIEVNDVPTSKFVYGYYPVGVGKEQIHIRDDRRLSGISLNGSSDGSQSVTVPSAIKTVYVDMTDKEFTARAGEKVTPVFGYMGSWMHGYVYIDRDNDGKFDCRMNDDHTPAKGSDLMTFSFYGEGEDGYNSIGTRLTKDKSNVLNPPAFTIPVGLKNGYYRMRYKVDWNCIDPKGAMKPDNSILGNGGGMIDIRLNIHGDYCNVNDANRNGEVLAADGSKLVKYQAPFGRPFTIVMNPEKGFEYAGIIVKHGYNLSGDSIVRENVQWKSVRFDRKMFNEANEFTIPAACMNGDVEIEGLFVEEGTYVQPEEP